MARKHPRPAARKALQKKREAAERKAAPCVGITAHHSGAAHGIAALAAAVVRLFGDRPTKIVIKK